MDPRYDVDLATSVVKHAIDPRLRVATITSLQGGMVSSVLEWILEGGAGSIVCKLSREPSEALEHEFEALKWHHRLGAIPVPQPIACVTSEAGLTGTALLMEKVDATRLSAVKLSEVGRRHFETELADCLIKLHRHRGPKFGSPIDQTRCRRWLDWFSPKLNLNYREACPSLLAKHRYYIERQVLPSLHRWLPNGSPPTLVHGDVWAGNILLDASNPDRPDLGALIDGGVLYADVEYELAYLLVFATVGPTFFARYREHMPIRDGFAKRCRIYWLNTMLLHVHLFGDDYLPHTERIIDELMSMSA